MTVFCLECGKKMEFDPSWDSYVCECGLIIDWVIWEHRFGKDNKK